MPPVNQRIKSIVDNDFGGSVRQFALAMGISDYQKINRIFKEDTRNGKIPSPSINVLSLISNTFDISLEWLQTGEGTKERNGKPANQKPIKPQPQACLVPLLPLYAQGGALTDFVASVQMFDCEHIISPIHDAEFAITIAGDSMAPEFPNGAKILIKRINEAAFIEWGRIYVLDTCNGVVIKQLRKGESDDEVACYSLNPDPCYQPFTVKRADIYGIYRVLMLMAPK